MQNQPSKISWDPEGSLQHMSTHHYLPIKTYWLQNLAVLLKTFLSSRVLYQMNNEYFNEKIFFFVSFYTFGYLIEIIFLSGPISSVLVYLCLVYSSLAKFYSYRFRTLQPCQSIFFWVFLAAFFVIFLFFH